MDLDGFGWWMMDDGWMDGWMDDYDVDDDDDTL